MSESQKRAKVTVNSDHSCAIAASAGLSGGADGAVAVPVPEDLERHRKTPLQNVLASVSGDENAVAGNTAPSAAGGKRTGSGAAILNSDGPWARQSRSLYLGPLPEDCTVRELCDVIRGDSGLEAIRLVTMKERRCAFVDFIRRRGADRFTRRVVDGPGRGRLLLRTRAEQPASSPEEPAMNTRVGWAKESVMQPNVMKAVENGATRNVFFSGIPPAEPDDPLNLAFQQFCSENEIPWRQDDAEAIGFTEITDPTHPWVMFLFHEVEPFGAVDMIKVVPGRRIAFVHMSSVAQAMRVAAELPIKEAFRNKRISFGRDRCGERVEEAASAEAGAAEQHVHTDSASATDAEAPAPVSRTVYLGNCSKEQLTVEAVCDLVHCGQLQSVRVNMDRCCAFVTFVEAEAACRFLAMARQFPLVLGGGTGPGKGSSSVLKVDWAKESGAGGAPHSLPLAVAQALQRGYTRNLYLGNIDPAQLTVARLRAEFESRFHCLIDTVHVVDSKRVAFVHFAGVLDAGRAFEALKRKEVPGFEECRVGFGRDRCEPRPMKPEAVEDEPLVSAASAPVSGSVSGSVSGPGSVSGAASVSGSASTIASLASNLNVSALPYYPPPPNSKQQPKKEAPARPKPRAPARPTAAPFYPYLGGPTGVAAPQQMFLPYHAPAPSQAHGYPSYYYDAYHHQMAASANLYPVHPGHQQQHLLHPQQQPQQQYQYYQPPYQHHHPQPQQPRAALPPGRPRQQQQPRPRRNRPKPQ